MKAIALRVSALRARVDALCARLTISAPQALACLFGFFALLTVFRTPTTLLRTFSIMRPNGGGVRDDRFLGFALNDSMMRPAYRRIATNFVNHGRYGYTWGDAFGLTMRERFGNSSVTYRLLHMVGSRRISFAGYLLFGCASLIVLSNAFGYPLALLAALLFLGTPVLVYGYTSGGGKTETFWYPAILATLTAAFAGHTLTAALAWSVLALCNCMGPLLTGAVVGPALLAWSIQHDTVADLLIGTAPGLLLYLYRFSTPGAAYIAKTLRYLLIASRDVGAMLNGGRPHRDRWPVLDEWLAAGPVTAALLYGAWTRADLPAALLAATCFTAYYTSRRGFFLSDFQSFDLLFLAIGIAYAATTGDPVILAIVFIGAHRMRDNRFACLPLGQTMDELARQGVQSARDRWYAILRTAIEMTDGFPHIEAVPRPNYPMLDQFWQAIPDHARVAVETARSSGPMLQAYPDHWMRSLWFLTDDIFPARNIELATKEFTFTLEHELMMHRLAHLNAGAMTPDRFNETCAAAGISHMIVLTRPTAEMLQAAGWHPVAGFDFSTMGVPTRTLLMVTVPGMALFARTADDFSIVTPKAAWHREGNRLVIEATAGTSYTIRYRYFPEFQARQNGQRLPVEPCTLFDDVPHLTFMKVTAATDGPLELCYVDHPGRVLFNRIARLFRRG